YTAAGNLLTAPLGPRIVLPGRLESAAQFVAEPGPALDLLLSVQDQVRSAVTVRPQGDRPGIRTHGSNHPPEGHHRQTRPEQFPAAGRTLLEFSSQVGLPRLVWRDDVGQQRSGGLRRIRRRL